MERPRTTIPRLDQSDSFIFKQRSGALNWKEIQNLDIDEVIHKGDIDKINELLDNITYSNIQKDDLEKYPDSFIIKLFRLSQFALEYLQEKDKRLKEENKEIVQEKNIIIESSKQLEGKMEQHQKLLKRLNREVQHKKKTLSTYEYLLKQPATMSYMNRAINKDKAVKCPKCSKLFASHDYFLKHNEKRHEVRPSTAPVSNLDSIKTTLEKQLKTMQEEQEKETIQFKTMITQQLLDFKEIRQKNIEKQPIKSSDFSNIAEKIELERKQLLQMKEQERYNKEILRKKEEEIYRLEYENKKLIKSKEKLERLEKNSEIKFSDSVRIKNNVFHEDTFYSQEEYTPKTINKFRSESGETNVLDVMNGLIAEPHFKEIFKDEEIYKREAATPYSERLSPSLKEYDQSNEYIMPLDNPQTENIIEAAKVLGIDPVKETQLLYLATEFLKSPVPKTWIVTKKSNKTVFRNKETNQLQDNHPGIEYFKELYRQKKNKKNITFDKVKTLIGLITKKILHEKYPDGIKTLFKPDPETFTLKKTEIRKKIQEALDKMKNISNQQLSKISEEREKIFAEKGGEYRRANEIISSELLTIFNKVKK
jgi:uncharacterized C2H2 Zn-finger protein